jgi:hypothetical protein
MHEMYTNLLNLNNLKIIFSLILRYKLEISRFLFGNV